jgi:hypothetical protein
MWKDLQRDPPKGEVDISLIMHKIERELPDENSFVEKFKNLMNVFRKYGVEIPKGSMCVSIGEFRILQEEIYDNALKTIWSSRLRDSLNLLAIPLPPSDASAEQIRKFLNDPANSVLLTQITELNLDKLNLKAVPPELNQLSGLLVLSLSNNRLSSVPDFAHLQNLQRLSLGNNWLSSVPDFANLQNLQMLSLRNNQLSSTPNFPHHQNLQVFME